MQKNSRLDTMPERHQYIADMKSHIALIENFAQSNPDEEGYRVILASAKAMLADAERVDDEYFLQHAKEFAIYAKMPSYPHSLKTWYEDDFKPFMEEYLNER